ITSTALAKNKNICTPPGSRTSSGIRETEGTAPPQENEEANYGTLAKEVGFALLFTKKYSAILKPSIV
ncbi:hypothetical protein TNCV_503291, partial [Trichonephila clavipes]